jgi:alpha-1,2-mannosyltransferase
MRAWGAWFIFACVIGVVVAQAPDYRTVTPNYRDACHNWFQGQPIYAEGVHGFLYFPHAAILFAPFAYLSNPVGEVLWRLVSIGSLALAVWRFSISTIQNRYPRDDIPAFALMTVLAIPPAIASARNGQMNLMLAGLAALAFVEVATERWRAATFWLCLGAAFKPLMIVPMAIAAVVYQPIRRRLVWGVFILQLAPFLTQYPGYVWQQYAICTQKLFLASNPGAENPASDLFGLLSMLGYAAPLAAQTAARVVAGILTVVVALLAVRRHNRVGAAHSALALTACYLALFNPRMENNGFVVLSPTLGLIAADALLNGRRILPGLVMLAASLGIAGSYEITRGHNFWLCPLLTLVVWYYAIVDALSPEAVCVDEWQTAPGGMRDATMPDA